MRANEQFSKWGQGFSGCDGGDIGTPEDPSIWVCGIEWGGGHSPDALISAIQEDVTTPPSGYDDWQQNLAYRFNWNVMKLFSSINGGAVGDYKKFAEGVRPFTNGISGYFKMNLYPIAFKNTSPSRWQNQFSAITGFEGKRDYLSWSSDVRFPQMRRWAEEAKPNLIVCLGKTYLPDFKAAFHDRDAKFNHEVIDERDLFWSTNPEGSLIVVIPFMTNRFGLVKNTSIHKFGRRISQLLNDQVAV